MSHISRRSNLTMITLKSHMTGVSGKSKALPREPRLRDNAIRRMNEAQIKEIEGHLRRIRNTQDLSYSNVKQQSASEEGETAGGLPVKKMVDAETLMRLIDECRDE